ncbi:MAG: hypothetical protein ACRDFS_09065 [Chloroflexota bacterium]
MHRLQRFAISGIAVGAMLTGVFGATAHAAPSTVVVTPANTQGWAAAESDPTSSYQYVTDPTSPYPSGALQLATSDATGHIQYLKATNTNLSDVTELSYYTKYLSGGSLAAPSYQLATCVNGFATDGACSASGSGSGFTTFVFEPYENGTVDTTGKWQKWDVAAGEFWSSHSVTNADPACNVKASQGTYLYTLPELQACFPDAVVEAFGVNVGSNNPGYTVETDGVDFNGTTYDFQTSNVPTSKDQCKKGGYQNLTDADGNAFRNQGQCVSYFNHNG